MSEGPKICKAEIFNLFNQSLTKNVFLMTTFSTISKTKEILTKKWDFKLTFNILATNKKLIWKKKLQIGEYFVDIKTRVSYELT